MFIQKVLCAIFSLTLLLGSCSSEKTCLEKPHLGGCILTSPAAEAPRDLYQESNIVTTDEYKPFTKKLSVYGITLIARDDISDPFMRKIAKTVKEMFPRGGAIDDALQEDVLRNLYRYRVAIPLFKGEAGFDSEEEWTTYGNMKLRNSVCDIIMEGEPGRQVMEVVEHILHHVTDVGLHYTFPDEWGISKSSKLYQAMREAIDKDYYDASSYEDIDDEARERVMLQEFAYLLITTAWDLQEPYGGGADEWTRGGKVGNSADLKAKLPRSYQLFEQTIPKVMVSPSKSTLDGFIKAPTRALPLSLNHPRSYCSSSVR
ncbi:hypothetical protein ACFL1G_01600 [Planctomycetota bacterium]